MRFVHLERIEAGRAVDALHLTAMALAADAANQAALAARLKALQSLRDRCRNSNECGWLDYSIKHTQEKR